MFVVHNDAKNERRYGQNHHISCASFTFKVPSRLLKRCFWCIFVHIKIVGKSGHFRRIYWKKVGNNLNKYSILFNVGFIFIKILFNIIPPFLTIFVNVGFTFHTFWKLSFIQLSYV